MKKTQIVIHLMPYEIDWFEWQAKQLKQAAHFLENDDYIIVDITLNLNFVDWKNSLIPKEYFVTKFNQIIKTCFDWCKTMHVDINDDNTCLGCADKRRTVIKETTADQIIYLDCDLIFPAHTLKLLLDSAKQIVSEYFIISPQIPKLWDSSWYVLMNNAYRDFIWDNKTFIDPYTVITSSYDSYKLTPIDTFKLGGGWFNLFSTNLLKLIGVPDSFGPYGPDDTFIMYGCQIMKTKNYNVQQYIIENLVVSENHKYRTNPYTDFIKNKNDRESFRSESEKNLQIEVTNLQQRL
jgi:hypothetical protein